MTVKSADGDDLETSEISKTLRSAQEEDWVHHKYFDENVNGPTTRFNIWLTVGRAMNPGRPMSACSYRKRRER
jgi:hypothetical protein